MNLNIGAGKTSYDGWVATDRHILDITSPESWHLFVSTNGKPERVLGEHVWEHLTPYDAELAARLLFQNMTSGRARIAVPDGNHPDAGYIKHIAPPGCGHVTLYDYRTLPVLFMDAGFSVRLVEWWDYRRQFHTAAWDSVDGHIVRSLQYDHRNADGKPNFTSLIIDCFKA